MSKLEDIKDVSPNKSTIEQLESMLKDAKAGDLRTLIAISGWSDDTWTHAWVLDSRTSRLRMIGKICEMQHEVLTNNSLGDEESILSKALE